MSCASFSVMPGMPGMPGTPAEPGPDPQSCDIDCSQSPEKGPQGCLGQVQEG